MEMDAPRKVYVNEKWWAFSQKVKQRDGHRCLRCGRGEPQVVLQVHHEHYRKGCAPWDYPLSDCRTLCKGCHARVHRRLAPDRGWSLLQIEDLGAADGVCERPGCGHEIRYAHLSYHPAWGYMSVGSTCIEHLTQEDRLLSAECVRAYKNISHFLHTTHWREERTRKGTPYLSARYRQHSLRIYGQPGHYAFQLVLKEKGVRWHEYREIVRMPNKSLQEVQELAYIALKGTLVTATQEKALLRAIYRRLK